MNLLETVTRGEDVSCEFKRELSRDLAKEVAAFASSYGGSLLVGVTDADQKIVGLNVPFEVARDKIQSWIHEFVRPPPPYEIEKIEEGELELLLIRVFAGQEAAYAFKECFYYRNNEQSQRIPANEIERRFNEAQISKDLIALALEVAKSKPEENIAAGITGQGELATVAYEDLLVRLARDLRSHFVAK